MNETEYRNHTYWLGTKPRYETCVPTRTELARRILSERKFLPFKKFKRMMNSVGCPGNIKHYVAHIVSSITTSFGSEHERLAWILLMPKNERQRLLDVL